ncbi:hypothetical protein GTS_50570 [Gandjariella thermophila]|uniref:Uncharacterized protein n=2 Tax=Gandjariella thermophila TaxID=1931992 RepID=A0A4D4JCR9_9PSEU|nr:hypothetical protein GTS_50570 [Gandjariella thermophila]
MRAAGHDTSAAAERRRFLESAAAVTVSAERTQHRTAVRVLRALGYREEIALPRTRRAPVTLLGRVLGDGLRPRGRFR